MERPRLESNQFGVSIKEIWAPISKFNPVTGLPAHYVSPKQNGNLVAERGCTSKKKKKKKKKKEKQKKKKKKKKKTRKNIHPSYKYAKNQ